MLRFRASETENTMGKVTNNIMFIKCLQDEFRSLKEHKISLIALAAMLLAVTLMTFFSEATTELLQYDRQLILQGQWWRLYTGNWVHFGGYHIAMNVLGLAAIAYSLFLRRHDLAWWLGVALVPWGVGICLYYFSADTDIYRGFSAAAYGILILGLLLEWRFNPWIMSIALAVLLGKILYEQMPGYDINYLQSEIGVAVAIDAHLWGVSSGLLLAVAILSWGRFRRKGKK